MGALLEPNQLHELTRLEVEASFVEHVSIKCEHCNARLEFNFSEDQDEAVELDNARHAANWRYVQGGLACDVCGRESLEPVRVERTPYSKPWMIRP